MLVKPSIYISLIISIENFVLIRSRDQDNFLAQINSAANKDKIEIKKLFFVVFFLSPEIFLRINPWVQFECLQKCLITSGKKSFGTSTPTIFYPAKITQIQF